MRVVERLVAVHDGVGNMCGDVLAERAAHGDINQLATAADAEHRLALHHEFPDEFDFVQVADTVARPVWTFGGRAIAFRADVGAALQDQTVEGVDEVAC